MKLLSIGIDITALSIMTATIMNALPVIVTVGVGILAIIYYGFVIHDRIKYGPETEHRSKK